MRANGRITPIAVLAALITCGVYAGTQQTPQTCCAVPPPAKQGRPVPAPVPTTVEDILQRLRQRTEALRTYQCKLRYLFIQEPELLDSRTLSEGLLFYARDPNRPDPRNPKRRGTSTLRVNFQTRQQDDGKKMPHREELLFDGVWLTRLDYAGRKIDRYQKAPTDKPVDVFELIEHNFPIIGFSRTQALAEQFDIRLAADLKADLKAPIHLRLRVKKTSKFKDDYDTIDFYIDRTLFLPQRIVTTNTQGDIYDITFLAPKVNKPLPSGVFEIQAPDGFERNIHPLKPSTGDPTPRTTPAGKS